MKWIYYQHQALHESVRDAVRYMTTLLFFLEIPYTIALIQAVPYEFLRFPLFAVWAVVGSILFVAYHIFTETNVTRRTQFIMWTSSAVLNALIALGTLVTLIVMNLGSGTLQVQLTAFFSLPVGYFGAKAVMSAYLAGRAWNHLEEARADQERVAALQGEG